MRVRNFVFVVLFTIINLPVLAHEHMRPEARRTIAVSGKSVLSASPDMATVQFAIITQNKDPERARKENGEISANVLNAVRALGIPEKKINLESLNINEEFRYNNKTNTSESIGYKAIRQFKVVLEMPLAEPKALSDKLAEVVAAVVSKGSNQLQNVDFGLIDSSKLTEQALNFAVANAMLKAERMLEPLVGTKLGKVITLSETTSYRPPVYARSMNKLMMADMAAVESVQADSFNAGDLEVEANVSAVFEIE